MRTRTRMGLVVSASILAGVTGWAHGTDTTFAKIKSFKDLRSNLREQRYLVADQIIILEAQRRDLGSRILEAEARAKDLRARLQDTELELVRARELLGSLHGDRTGR
jgi:hypothetical protein